MLTDSDLKLDPLVLFGQRLVQLRKQRGWSQEQLALECGMARSYLGGVERGKRNIALLNICKLADALSVSPAEMLQFHEDSTQN
jgi:transcriptional regulator with XRE-family HTH domain